MRGYVERVAFHVPTEHPAPPVVPVEGRVDVAPLEETAGKAKGGRRKQKPQVVAMEGDPDPDCEERRRIRRRHQARLKAARLGRSRGGLSSKVHLASDPRCRPLCFDLTEGQAADSPRFVPVLNKIKVRGPVGRPRTLPDAIAGDRAYSSRANRAHLRKRNIQAVIPEKSDQAANRKKKGRGGGRPISHDTELYKGRNSVERCINKIKAWRGLATPYDKSPESYLAGLHLRGGCDLAPQPPTHLVIQGNRATCPVCRPPSHPSPARGRGMVRRADATGNRPGRA